jgi:hypothetical protein
VNARVAAGLIALVAAGVHLGLTTRYRAEAAAAADEFRQVRDERRRVAGQLGQKLRLEDAQRRAGRLPAEGEGGPLTPARAARLQVVRSLEGSGIERVRLGVAPALLPPKTVNVRLRGEGSFEDVVRFAGQVARPGSGLLLQEVALDTRQDRVGLSLDAMGLGRP